MPWSFKFMYREAVKRIIAGGGGPPVLRPRTPGAAFRMERAPAGARRVFVWSTRADCPRRCRGAHNSFAFTPGVPGRNGPPPPAMIPGTASRFVARLQVVVT